MVSHHHWLLHLKSQITTTSHQPATIGILSFELATILSKTIHLHNSITNSNISILITQTLNSTGIKTLISSDEMYLINLTASEYLSDLHQVAAAAATFCQKSTVPHLVYFKHVYNDIVSGTVNVNDLGFLVKDMDAMVKRFERYVNTTAKLYNELEVLNQLETGKNKFKMHQHEESRKAFEQKVVWQMREVRGLKDASLWNRTFDKVMEMVARTVCTLYSRICVVFGDTFARRDMFVSGSGRGSGMGPARLLTECLNRASSVSGSKFNAFDDGSGKKGDIISRRGVFVSDSVRTNSVCVDGFSKFRDHEDYSFVNSGCGMGPGRLFMECLNRTSSVSVLCSKFDTFDDGSVKKGDDDQSSKVSGACSVSSNVRKDIKNLKTRFKTDPKNKLLLQASEATVGGSALALHYANVIIVIEKLLKYPHLVGEEARDDLYQMLPTSLRLALKTSLKSYVKDLAIYDAPIAHDWKDRLDGILGWLGPMAHNMIRWQNERNFEQQQIVSRTNVLLLQTLYFADRTKTEAAICELLVGLNYICRYEHQQNALLDCASSFDFEECVEWQTEY